MILNMLTIVLILKDINDPALEFLYAKASTV